MNELYKNIRCKSNFDKDKLKAFRAARGFTQNELGGKIDYHTDMVSRVERGRLLPSLEFINKLHSVFNLPPYYFKKDISS